MTLNTILLFGIVSVFTFCKGQNQKPRVALAEQATTISIGEKVSELAKSIDCIFQDKYDNYWFASNGEGIYRYDGKTILHITDKDGLCSNFVWAIQEDSSGNLWFTTRDGFCSFNGKTFTSQTENIKNAAYGTFTYIPGGLFFNHSNGICFYDGLSFTNFTIHPSTYTPEMTNMYRPYGVYYTLADKTGNVWFGTQEKGVCVYDGKTFSFISEKNLAGPAVRSIYQDKKGTLWFGNNGGGFYRYDGKTLSNITEEKNLGNAEFLKEKKSVDKPGSLARVFAINEDRFGNIWIGTVDAGVWKYDGTNLVNYTVKDGLSGNSVPVIYKDKKGELWFVSEGNTVCRFNGQSFSKVDFKSIQ